MRRKIWLSSLVVVLGFQFVEANPALARPSVEPLTPRLSPMATTLTTTCALSIASISGGLVFAASSVDIPMLQALSLGGGILTLYLVTTRTGALFRAREIHRKNARLISSLPVGVLKDLGEGRRLDSEEMFLRILSETHQARRIPERASSLFRYLSHHDDLRSSLASNLREIEGLIPSHTLRLAHETGWLGWIIHAPSFPGASLSEYLQLISAASWALTRDWDSLIQDNG